MKDGEVEKGVICTMRKRNEDDDDRTHPLCEKGDTMRKRNVELTPSVRVLTSKL